MFQISTTRDLGYLAKALRKKSGMTQEELAAAAGTGARFIGELEHGKPTCEVDKVLRVLKMLGVKLLAETPPGLEHTTD